MEQTKFQSNQQETLIDSDISYVAGLMDGEGSFPISKINARKEKRPRYVAGIFFSNTDCVLVNSMVDFLEKQKIAYYIRKDIRGDRKTCYQVTVSKINSMIRFIDLVNPYLRGKKKSEASLLKKFLNHKIQREKERVGLRNGKGQFIDRGEKIEDQRFYEEGKSIRGSSETTRIDPSKKVYTIGDKI